MEILRHATAVLDEPCLCSQISRARLSNELFANLFGEEPEPVRVGRYRILRKLGEGGMGMVYLVEDELLGRKVALKLLRRRHELTGQRRFVREARALARVSHHNVVQIHEIGEHAGQAFIVMEFIEGWTLRSWLALRPRTEAEILEVFRAASRGLQAAHDRGLVHRDFKPANVIVGVDGRVVVVDFGLARDLDGLPSTADPGAGLDGGAELTKAGTILGTPAYMAPEQFEGRMADARSDQFSFCVALWEALHGARPFVGVTVAELRDAVCSGSIVAAEGREVPDWLGAVLRRGLSVEPGRRWPSLRALAAALRPPPKPWQRGLVALIRALVLLLAALGGWQGSRLLPELDALASVAGSAALLRSAPTQDPTPAPAPAPAQPQVDPPLASAPLVAPR